MVMKRCCRCGDEKDEGHFNWRNKAKGLRQAHCKPCQKKSGSEHYQGNKSAYGARAKAYKFKVLQRWWVWLTTKSCVDCGESDLVVLDCDHVFGTKVGSVGRLVRERSWAIVEAELEKCVVRCANCHRRKTAREAGWYSRVQVITPASS